MSDDHLFMRNEKPIPLREERPAPPPSPPAPPSLIEDAADAAQRLSRHRREIRLSCIKLAIQEDRHRGQLIERAREFEFYVWGGEEIG